MNDTEHPTLDTVFANLDRWRHFAGYPLEPRVDAFMGLFLPKVIENRCSAKEVNPQLLPQFPLKKPYNNQSDKVDFLAVTKDVTRAFLVEIKTDMGSLRKGQRDYLDRARHKGLARLLSEFKEIVKASSGSRRKYFHLLTALSEMRLLRLPPKLEEMVHCGETKGTTGLIEEIEIRVPGDSKLEVVFVQPTLVGSEPTDGFRHICFGEFAHVIDGSGQLGSLLAHYLRRWITDPGACPSREA